MYNQFTPNFKNQFELEKQLHEQYAINNNAKVSSFVSFIVALFALFGFYGYIFAYTTPEFSTNGIMVIENGGCNKSDTFSLDIFIVMSLIVSGLLYFLSKMSLTLGYGQRNDQIVIDRIREKHYPNEQDRTRLFGKGYTANNKGWCNFVQDYFNLFYWLFFWSQIFVIVSSIIKLSTNIRLNGELLLWAIILVIVTLTIEVYLSYLTIANRSRYCQKYLERLEDNVVEPTNTTEDNSFPECNFRKKLLVVIWGRCCYKDRCPYRKKSLEK